MVRNRSCSLRRGCGVRRDLSCAGCRAANSRAGGTSRGRLFIIIAKELIIGTFLARTFVGSALVFFWNLCLDFRDLIASQFNVFFHIYGNHDQGVRLVCVGEAAQQSGKGKGPDQHLNRLVVQHAQVSLSVDLFAAEPLTAYHARFHLISSQVDLVNLLLALLTGRFYRRRHCERATFVNCEIHCDFFGSLFLRRDVFYRVVPNQVIINSIFLLSLP